MSKLKAVDEQSFEQRLSFSLRDASDATGFCPNHFRNEAARGKLRLVKSGRRTIILADELHRYLSELAEFQPTK